MAASTGRLRTKAKGTPGQDYSSTNFRILKKYERMLLHASIYLQAVGEPINTPQEMVEDAVSKYIEFLRKKHNVPFPDYLTSGEKPNAAPLLPE